MSEIKTKRIDPKKVFDGKCEFILGAHNFSQAPESACPEVAFIGASNVGKSSLINAILGKKVAIVSGKPGRTRQLNFFRIPNGFTQSYSQGFLMVDMPGYGFAKAKSSHVEHWQKTALEYLMKRTNLKRLFLLIDPIKGLKESDRDMVNMLNAVAVSFQVVFTKIDKLNREKTEQAKEKILKEVAKWPAAHPEIVTTSSTKGYGTDDIQNAIVEVLQNL